jgi:hypothetical protein
MTRDAIRGNHLDNDMGRKTFSFARERIVIRAAFGMAHLEYRTVMSQALIDAFDSCFS